MKTRCFKTLFAESIRNHYSNAVANISRSLNVYTALKLIRWFQHISGWHFWLHGMEQICSIFPYETFLYFQFLKVNCRSRCWKSQITAEHKRKYFKFLLAPFLSSISGNVVNQRNHGFNFISDSPSNAYRSFLLWAVTNHVIHCLYLMTQESPTGNSLQSVR